MGDFPKNVRDVVGAFKSARGKDLEALVSRYAQDPRAGVAHAVEGAKKRLAADGEAIRHSHELYAAMRELGGQGCIVGIDEVGRGAIAGPLTVAAVVLPDSPQIIGLDDSKRLTPQRREVLAREIRSHAQGIGVFHVSPEEIDEIGMSAALRKAMLGALEDCAVRPDAVLIDGNPVKIHSKERCVVRGDSKVACIAAASIIAKVTRDRLMVLADSDFPGYAFAKSKGYASPEHIAAIRERGLSPLHRKSFCSGLLCEQTTLF